MMPLKSVAFVIVAFTGALVFSIESFGQKNAADQTGEDRTKAEYDYAYALAMQATIYGWAPVMMDIARELQTSVTAPMDNGQAPMNQLGPITRLWDYRDRSYATANNDTLYLQGWFDLEEQPVVLYVPPIKDRYWMQQILDMYTESVVDLCNSTVGDKGGYFMLAKTGHNGDRPDNIPVYFSRTRYVWLAGRLGVSSDSDLAAAREIQKLFRIMPLDQYPNGGVQPKPKSAGNAAQVEFPSGLDWFKKLDKVLRENPLPEDAPMTEQLKQIGIGNDRLDELSETQRRAVTTAFKDALNVITDAAKFSETPVNGWNWEFNAGKYGSDYLARSAINMNSIGLNSPERAMYPKRYVDDKGAPLNGKHMYTLTLPADMPVRTDVGGFWSITMYDAVDRFMVDNEMKRQKVGSMTDGLIRNDDGTLTIYISHKKPSEKKALANWLPAPNDNFMLQCRLYEPKQSVVDGEFKLPELYKQ